MTKTMSFAVVHFTVAFSVGYAMTGSVLVGGAIDVVAGKLRVHHIIPVQERAHRPAHVQQEVAGVL